MNPTLVGSTFHRLLTRPLALAVIAAYALFAFFSSSFYFLPQGLGEGGSFWLGHGCAPLVWVLGAGLVGADVSSGSLALLLSRPLSRSRYLFSRWLGLVAAVLAVHVGLFSLMLLLHSLSAPLSGFSPQAAANALLSSGLITVGHASLLVLLSSFLPGIGDGAAYVGAYVVTGFVALSSRGHALDVGRAALWLLLPGTEALRQAQAGQLQQAWSLGLGYLALAALQVWAAARILEARDLSYVNR